jgi:hypothetical protein
MKPLALALTIALALPAAGRADPPPDDDRVPPRQAAEDAPAETNPFIGDGRAYDPDAVEPEIFPGLRDAPPPPWAQPDRRAPGKTGPSSR